VPVDEPTPEMLTSWDCEYVWHPFTPMQAYRDEHTPVIVSGEGFHLIDATGNRYLDGNSSLWCNVHGHRVDRIDEAIQQQLAQLAHSTLLGLGNAPSIRLAQQLVSRTPVGLNKVFYSDSGATAVEVALKIAFQYHQQNGAPQRDRFLCLSEAYHGDTIGSVSVGGIDLFHGKYGPLLFPTIQLPTPVAYRFPKTCTAESYLAFCYDQLEQTIVEQHERIAGFVIEPLVQGAAGILVHPEGYLKRVRELTAEYNIPLIADEVAVGFGRTGTLFACEQETVTPDILCLAKGITGGYLPLAATLVTDDIYDGFLGEAAAGRTFYHGHTYTGNPLGCAAALASLQLFDEHQVLDNVQQTSSLLTGRLTELESHPHVGEVRQSGLMTGIELVADRASKQPFPVASQMGHRVTLAARKRGVITRPLGDVIVLMPAPAMPAECIEELCDVVFTAIDEVTQA